MIKFIKEDTLIGFREIPEEATLCINISNCQNNCVGCHSPYLKKDIGEELNFKAIDELIKENDGITCFCFMGEGNDSKTLKELALYIKGEHPGIKIGIYSGREKVEEWYWDIFDYIKIGPYIKKFGPLDKVTTNQRLYVRCEDSGWRVDINGNTKNGWDDITDKFWR